MLFASYRLDTTGVRILMVICAIVLLINSVACAIILPVAYLRSLRDYGELISYKTTISECNSKHLPLTAELIDRESWYMDTLSKYKLYSGNAFTRLFVAKLPEELR